MGELRPSQWAHSQFLAHELRLSDERPIANTYQRLSHSRPHCLFTARTAASSASFGFGTEVQSHHRLSQWLVWMQDRFRLQSVVVRLESMSDALPSTLVTLLPLSGGQADEVELHALYLRIQRISYTWTHMQLTDSQTQPSWLNPY